MKRKANSNKSLKHCLSSPALGGLSDELTCVSDSRVLRRTCSANPSPTALLPRFAHRSSRVHQPRHRAAGARRAARAARWLDARPLPSSFCPPPAHLPATPIHRMHARTYRDKPSLCRPGLSAWQCWPWQARAGPASWRQLALRSRHCVASAPAARCARANGAACACEHAWRHLNVHWSDGSDARCCACHRTLIVGFIAGRLMDG